MTEKNKRPNIVLLIMDSARSDMFGCYGSNLGLTPFIDTLAEKGLLCRKHLTAGSGSAQSHVSIFTGQHPFRHKMLHNLCQVRKDLVSITSLLKQLGYANYGHCKASLAPPSGYADLFKFDELNFPSGKRSSQKNVGILGRLSEMLGRMPSVRALAKSIFDRWIPDEMRLRARASMFDGQGSLDYLFQRIKESHGKTPVFVYSTLLHPHTPYYPPKRFLKKVFGREKIHPDCFRIQLNMKAYGNGDFGEAREALVSMKKCYQANLMYGDYLIKNFVDRLHREGLMDNTILVITADHGELLGEHGDINHEGMIWEELLNTPCIFYGPNLIKPAVIGHYTSGVDITPTLMDLLGELAWTKKQTVFDGFSLFSEVEKLRKRDIVVDSPPVVLPGRFKKYPNILLKENVIRRTIKTDSHKYVWQSNGECALYQTGDEDRSDKNILHREKQVAEEHLQKMMNHYIAIDPAFKIDEYPVPIAQETAKRVNDLEVRQELIRLGYL